jgi:hypothetical protein
MLTSKQREMIKSAMAPLDRLDRFVFEASLQSLLHGRREVEDSELHRMLVELLAAHGDPPLITDEPEAEDRSRAAFIGAVGELHRTIVDLQEADSGPRPVTDEPDTEDRSRVAAFIRAAGKLHRTIVELQGAHSGPRPVTDEPDAEDRSRVAAFIRAAEMAQRPGRG